MIHEFTSHQHFFPQIWDQTDPLNSDDWSKMYSETRQTGLQILVKSKMMVRALSNKARNNALDLYFMIHEFTSIFFSKLGIRNPLCFDNWSKWHSEMRRTSLQIIVESKLSRL